MHPTSNFREHRPTPQVKLRKKQDQALHAQAIRQYFVVSQCAGQALKGIGPERKLPPERLGRRAKHLDDHHDCFNVFPGLEERLAPKILPLKRKCQPNKHPLPQEKA